MPGRETSALVLLVVLSGVEVFVQAGHTAGSSVALTPSSGHSTALTGPGDANLALRGQVAAESFGASPPDLADGHQVYAGQLAELAQNDEFHEPTEFLIPGDDETPVPLPIPVLPGIGGSTQAYRPLEFSSYAGGKSMEQFLLEKLPADFMTKTFGDDGMPDDDPGITVEHRWLHNTDEAAMERETLFNLKLSQNQQNLDDAGGDYKLSGPGADTLVVSVGSSSTQIYSANEGDTASFDCGTLNFDPGQVGELADAVEASGMRKVLLINSVGRAGTSDDEAFVPLSDIAKKDLTKLPGVVEIASKFQAKNWNKDVKVFNRVKVEDGHGKKDYKYRQLDNNFADGLAEKSHADVVVDLGGSSMKIYHKNKRVFSATVYTNEVLVHDGRVDEGLTDYFCQRFIKAAVEAHVDGPVKRVVIGQTGQARELHFKDAEAIKVAASASGAQAGI